MQSHTAIRHDRLDHEAAILNTILASTEYGVLLTDLDHQSIACNPRFGELFGVPFHQVVTRSPGEVREMVKHRIPELEGWTKNLDEIYADQEREQTDLLELIGPRQLLHRVTRPVRDGEGQVVGRLWTFSDVTESVYRQRTRDLLFSISQMVDPDPGHVYREIVEAIGAFYGSICLLSIQDSDFLAFRAVGGPETPARNIAGNAMTESFCQFCLEAQSPLIIQDARLEVRARELLPTRLGLTRYLGVPVRLPSGELVGTLCIMDTRSDELLGPIDTELMSLCAIRIAAELHREAGIDARVQQLQRSREAQEQALRLTQCSLEAIYNSVEQILDSMGLAESAQALAEALNGFGGIQVLGIRLSSVSVDGPGVPLKLPAGHHGRLEIEDSGCPPENRQVYVPSLVNHLSLVLSRQILKGRLEQSSAELESTQTQLISQEKLAVSGAMAATIAHDIRNILATIAFDLTSKPSPESWQRLRTQIERFRVLNHRLLVYAKPQARVRQPVALGLLVTACLELIEPLATANHVQLTHIAPEEVVVAGDGSVLEHLVVNLVLNAIEAMAGRGGEIRLCLTKEAGKGRLTVADNGPGISASVQGSLFEPFVTSRRTGFGLGLYSCRRIVEEHEGSLSLVQTSEAGTTFEVRLPLA